MSSRQAGITLMELMIAVAIIGILASIAYPSYREQVRRSNRTEGKVALERRAQDLEKCYTRFMAYNNAACDALAAAATTPNGTYSVAATARAATTFTLQATPQGAQATDARCMNFTINEAGTRAISGSGTVAQCW
jgi:type IV pilus assembly protein PilE